MVEQIDQTAQKISLTCFMNSLLKEWDHFEILNDQLIFPLKNNWKLILPMTYVSVLGRHQYSGKVYLIKDSDKNEIEFFEAVDLISHYLSEHFQTDPSALSNFKMRVKMSEENIAKSLKARDGFFKSPKLDFVNSEQSLYVGHSFHPTPKSRDEFNDQDLKKYAPEFGGDFKLDWFLVHKSILFENKAESFHSDFWPQDIFDQEHTAQIPDGFVCYPMHPWQSTPLLKLPRIKQYESEGLLKFVGLGQKSWKATSSVRSIYREESPYMLKFSMSVKLTNSIRHLLAHEVERGVQLHDVLTTRRGEEFQKQNPNFKIITEPSFIAIRDVDGKPIPETLVVCRLNPFQFKNRKDKALLASLAQDGLNGENPITTLIKEAKSDLSRVEKTKKWFADYLNAVVRPLVLAASNEGIILGAHQQNLILDLKDGFPVGSYFRDCQGTGYSELGFQNFSTDVKSIYRENGNVVSEKMGQSLFIYYLFLNSTFNVISSLAQGGVVTEVELLIELKSYLKDLLQEGVRDPQFLNVILSSPQLLHKGNFLCAFQSLNENTTIDPLVIYKPIPNPLCREFL